MTALVLRYGTIAGLIVGVPMVWRMLTAGRQRKEPFGGMLITYLVMMVALTAVFLGREELSRQGAGRRHSFPAGARPGAGHQRRGLPVLYGRLGNLAGLQRLRHLEHLTRSASWKRPGPRGHPERNGQGDRGSQSVREKYANPFFRMPMTFIEMFPVGLLVSLITAAILRNSRVLPPRGAEHQAPY